MTPAVHQMVPSLRVGDATGAHTLAVRDTLRDLGLDSEIFAESAHPAVAMHTRPIDDYLEHTRRGGRPAAAIYQLNVGSHTAELFFSLPEPRVIDYHNITPPEFFAGWDDFEAMRTRVGRTQMERLGRRTDLALGDSQYNVADLVAHGYRCPTAVVPILLDLDRFDAEVDDRTLDRLMREKGRSGTGGADWLFVGRLVPNKAQHDLIKAFAVYRDLVDASARLRLVGSEGPERYVAALRDLAEHSGVARAVTFATGVSQAQLAAFYRTADVFVCLSEHEGFCIPLLEAMHSDVPIVAFAAAAVPETLGAAGLLLPDKDPLTVALAVDRVVSDADLRRQMIAAGRARLRQYSLAKARARLVAALEPVLRPS